ncbi:MAG: CNNM domain-containing protein [Bacteroidales bacterium]|nr:CNNM domain-containing protein [Bacteroidales bacterium]MCM1147902.1 CNNM domain-containing protein [Bacteroidales bacterium]MCM1205451.1 CNNM domain-containing protein [Bacillota bacterium]MCM1509287.1 CNNM domain-containing protein [Clostridium sp.]
MILMFAYLVGALFVSFLCSVLEAVLLSTPMSFITMKENEGAANAALLKEFKTNIDRPIAAILSLNTIAHTIGAAGVGAEAVKVFGAESFGIVSVVLTLLILVLSEIIPKTIGASHWRHLALPSTVVIRFMVIITYPLVRLSEYITKVFSSKESRLSVSREEVSAMVAVAFEEGVLRSQESKIIQNAFKLTSVSAVDIMTPNLVVVSVPDSMTVKEFFSSVELTYSRIPVYHDNKDYIIGYVLKMTILELLAKDCFDTRMSEIMRPILSFDEKKKVFGIWRKMLEVKEHISVICDRYGCLRGIVTMEDVIETMLGEEIVDEVDVNVDLQKVAMDKFYAMKSKC